MRQYSFNLEPVSIKGGERELSSNEKRTKLCSFSVGFEPVPLVEEAVVKPLRHWGVLFNKEF